METVQTLMFPQIQDRVTKFDSSDLYSYRKISPSMSSPSFGSFKSFLDDHDLQPSNGGILLQTLDVLKSNITWKSSKSNYCPLDESLTRTQRTWLLDIESLLKEMYNEVKTHRIDQAEIKSTNISKAIIQRSKTLPKSEHRKVLRRRRGHSVGTKNKPLPPIPHQKIETEFNQIPAQEHKQGIVMRKCVMEAADKKARNRQWQLCYLISSETELMMYRPILKSDSKGMRRKSMIFWHQSVCPSFSLQDIVNSETDEWQPDPNQPPLAAIPLNHCYATSLLPPGWNGQRPHVFRLETADGGLWMFETTDLYAVQAWVEAVNHAAALISKSPMQGAVCNIDYGWDCDKNTMMNHIAVWHPPTPCMIQSTLSLNEQYKELKSQIRELAQQLDQHRLLKPIIDKKSPASYRNQAIVNWDKKFHYVSNELTKLRCYRDVLKQKVTT